MKKRFLLVCVCWTLLTLLAGLLGVWQIHRHPDPGTPSELRAAKLGMGIGALTATGYAVFWLLFALTARKRDQKAKEDRVAEDEAKGTP